MAYDRIDKQSGRRIRETVTTVEGRNRSQRRRPRRERGYPPGGGFDRCECRVKGAFTEADSTFVVDNVIATKGPSPLDDPEDLAEEMTIHNCHGYAADDGALCKIEYHENDEAAEAKDRWHVYQVDCPAEA